MLKICPNCNGELIEKGEMPHIFFNRILKKYVADDQVVTIAYPVKEGVNTVIRFLEQNGFLKTTDGPSNDEVDIIHCIPTEVKKRGEHYYYCSRWGEFSHFLDGEEEIFFEYEEDQTDEY